MENKNIVMLKHHPMNVKFTNTFYVNQCSDLAERIIIDVTSRVTRDRAFMAEVYAPYYAKLIHNTESFKWMKKLVDEGKKIALVDFDGFNYYSPKAMGKLYDSYIKKCGRNRLTPNRELSDYFNIKTIRDAVNCSFLQVGHGFVIKMLLQGDLSINPDGSLNDSQGLLK